MNLRMPLKTIFFFWMVLVSCFSMGYSRIVAIDRYERERIFLDSQLNCEQEITGATVVADPIDACSNISIPPLHHFNYSLNWFVLIRDGGCDIIEKAYKAHISGYSAALIYEFGASRYLKPSRMKHSFIFYPNITVVVIDELSAENIIAKFIFNVDPESRLSIFPNSTFDAFLFLKLFVVTAVIFIITVLMFLIMRWVHRSWQVNNNRLSLRHLKSLPITRYKLGDPYETCAICLEDYKEKDKLRILPCSHGYHCKCIDPWLINNRRTCPICKQKINLPGYQSDEESSSDTESRAETTPLLAETARRLVSHGTFPSSQSIPSSIFNSSNVTGTHVHQVCSGETTSQDAPSLTDVENDRVGVKSLENIKPSSSAPNILMMAPVSDMTLIQGNMDHSEPNIFVATSDVFVCDNGSQSFVTSSNSVNNSLPRSSESDRFRPYVV